ncbi:hypothetical protein [Herbiconiux solani]|uniref:hypothetical protein n=1 Tax=Herbiconiux solani TaxID=661329 RepID=UPI000824867A|nr:hypothetical protein [Herbiconiux solani]
MDATTVTTETNAAGVFAVPHGLSVRPATIVPDMRDENLAMEFTGFDDTLVRGVLRSRATGDPVADTTFTARFLVVP